MDTAALVKEQMDDGEKLIKLLPQEGFEVAAAFWLKPTENGRWYFYIVSPIAETEPLSHAYRRLHTLLRGMPPPLWIDPLGVKLIGPTNPLAQDVLDIHKHSHDPVASPLRWGGIRLGNVSIEGAYLYPLPVAVPR